MFDVSNDQLRSSGIDLAHINFAPAVGSQEAVDVLTEIANTMDEAVKLGLIYAEVDYQ